MDNVGETSVAAAASTLSESGRFLALADTIDALVFVTEPSGKMLWTNQTFIEETGYRAEDFWFENQKNPFLHPDDAERVGDFLQAFASSSARNSTPIENRFFDRWGRIHTYCSRIAKIAWEGAEALMFVTRPLDDVSDERSTGVDGSYRSLVENADIGILKLSLDGRFHFSNRRFHELSGFDPVALKDRNFFGLMDPADREVSRQRFAVLADSSRIKLEVRLVGSRGQTLILEVGANRLEDPAEQGLVLATIRDITEARQLEMNIREAQKLESLGVFAGGIAHDFNNLMTAVLANASRVEALVDPHSEIGQAFHSIRFAGHQAAALSKTLLAYIGQAPTTNERVDVRQLAGDVAALARSVGPKSISITVDQNAGAAPVNVTGDRGQLSQVLMNLVINAAEAIPSRDGHPGDGRVTLSVDEVVATEALSTKAWTFSEPVQNARYARIQVRDTGAGIAPQLRHRIFDPFFTTKATGRGLGLAAVLGVVRVSRGAIAIESREGEGTLVEVLLPCNASEGGVEADVRGGSSIDASSPSRRSEPADDEASCARVIRSADRSILFVDDEWFLRETGRQILEDAGFHVTCAEDGARAMTVFEAAPQQFAAVVVDLTMPVVGGLEVVERFRTLVPNLPVVCVSGYRKEAGMKVPADTIFVEKPYEAAELVAAVKSVILARRPARSAAL